MPTFPPLAMSSPAWPSPSLQSAFRGLVRGLRLSRLSDAARRHRRGEARRPSSAVLVHHLRVLLDQAHKLVVFRITTIAITAVATSSVRVCVPSPWRRRINSIAYAHSAGPKSLNYGIVACGYGCVLFSGRVGPKGVKKQTKRINF